MADNLPHDRLGKLIQNLDDESMVVKRKSIFREYFEAFFTAVLLAFLIRSFIIEPYKIPSKSMVPTLLVGDHIFVNKFIYGLRIPGTKKWIAQFGNPKRGEVVVFIYPENEKLDFIKRVVGLPGDHLVIQGGKVFINDQEVTDTPVIVSGINPNNRRELILAPEGSEKVPFDLKPLPYYEGYENYAQQVEVLGDKTHWVQRSLLFPNDQERDEIIPEGHYFVMGDNRDQSADSREWGLVPRENLKGRAMFIWLSRDADLGGVRLGRFARKII